MGNNVLLEVSDLMVSYGAVTAIKGISISVEQGEIVALLGANGGGKSTLLKAIIGLIRPRAGSIKFAGQRINEIPTHELVALGITLIPEGRGILGSLSVFDNLMMGAYLRKDKKNVEKELNVLMDRFPILGERKNSHGSFLSGGEQQILALARGLINKPRLIMLDEPTWGLAPMLVNEIFNILKELSKEGTAILVSEQNAIKALKNASRAYILETGSVYISGLSSDLLHNERVKKAYLGN